MTQASSDPVRRKALNVLVVDDSAVVRMALTEILSCEPDMAVCTASDPIIALQKMEKRRPDVILLDLEMPRMDGLAFLHKVMAEDPIPVVICSGLAAKGTEAYFRALEEGAVEIVAKPKLGVKSFLYESAVLLADAVRAASQARLRPRPRASERTAPAPPALPSSRLDQTTEQVVLVGASTGGTEALRILLEAMPPDAPGIVVVQHMPELFTRSFAERLDATCRIEVKEASDLDPVRCGRALIAPGNRHLLLERSGGQYRVRLREGALVSRHRPSLDVLFKSAARAAAINAIGVIMTGMGADGAAGLLELKQAGAATLAQDAASCVVFGMPKEAIKLGAVDRVVPLDRLAHAVLALAQERSVSGLRTAPVS